MANNDLISYYKPISESTINKLVDLATDKKSLREIDIDKIVKTRGVYTPSPIAWEDESLYFMMLDRFSNGKEKKYYDNDAKLVQQGTIPPYNSIPNTANMNTWRAAGDTFCGGNLKSLTTKIGYLKRLGITVIWLSPVLKQISFNKYYTNKWVFEISTSYHGYANQNYLAIDANYGSVRDLIVFVETAHENGIYVILDIILNHVGRIFEYDKNSNQWNYSNGEDFTYNSNASFQFNDKTGNPKLPFGQLTGPLLTNQFPDGAVWPIEFQNPNFYTKKGAIQQWGSFPEYIHGDFNAYMYEINLGSGNIDKYSPSDALKALCEIYKFWIALADFDGFRTDTVKHTDKGAMRYFNNVIHEFTQSIGKESFYIIGEIADISNEELKQVCNIYEEHGYPEAIFEVMELTGLNAALGLGFIQHDLEEMIKGYLSPKCYFDKFRNSEKISKSSHQWFKNNIVTCFDDHDKLGQACKHRFCADVYAQKDNKLMALPLLALTSFTLGIPCIYYGTEQEFDGHGEYQGKDVNGNDKYNNSDKYIREAMFGGEFGAFKTQNQHFFNEQKPLYKEIAQLLKIRKDKQTLTRGRQFLREISGDGQHFGFPVRYPNSPQMLTIIAWSRIFNDKEIVIAINTDRYKSTTSWVTVDFDLHNNGTTMLCLYPSSLKGTTLIVQPKNNRKAIEITVPPAGVMIYE